MVTIEIAKSAFDEAAKNCPAYPMRFDGQGIVIPAGGNRYFTNAWVCINMLRRSGCTLPIEIWHLGPQEMTSDMRELVRPLGVETVDAWEIRKANPARILNGWEVKAYAILHSRFREVLLLDADNMPLRDPSFLFADRNYQSTGAIFWPDFGRLGPTRDIWSLTGVQYRDEPEFETGQIVVNKQKCWKPMNLAMWMNEHSDFWYQHIHGDKETFHMAWRKLEVRYAMPSRGIDALDGTMCQHDFEGFRIFQHRNMHKWKLYDNARIAGFEREQECILLLESVRKRLIQMFGLPEPRDADVSDLAGRDCVYERVCYEKRQFHLSDNGSIDPGGDRMERSWTVVHDSGIRVLKIYGDFGLTAQLTEQPVASGIWRGQWRLFEQMHIILRVIGN